MEINYTQKETTVASSGWKFFVALPWSGRGEMPSCVTRCPKAKLQIYINIDGIDLLKRWTIRWRCYCIAKEYWWAHLWYNSTVWDILYERWAGDGDIVQGEAECCTASGNTLSAIYFIHTSESAGTVLLCAIVGENFEPFGAFSHL